MALVLSGKNLKGRPNKKPSVGISSEREYGEVEHGGWIASGNVVPLYGTLNGATQK